MYESFLFDGRPFHGFTYNFHDLIIMSEINDTWLFIFLHEYFHPIPDKKNKNRKSIKVECYFEAIFLSEQSEVLYIFISIFIYEIFIYEELN